MYQLDGQLGCGDNKVTEMINQSSPIHVKALSSAGIMVAEVSCGGAHTCVLDPSGRLYSFGRVLDGQLGVGGRILENDGVGTPQLVESLSNVQKVVCGAFHTAAITMDGSLYTWGKEDYGMLGHGACENQYVPRKVKGLEGYCIV